MYSLFCFLLIMVPFLLLLCVGGIFVEIFFPKNEKATRRSSAKVARRK